MTDWHEVTLYIIVLVIFLIAAAVVTFVFSFPPQTECPVCAALQHPKQVHYPSQDENCMKFSPGAVENAKAAGCVWNGTRWRYVGEK